MRIKGPWSLSQIERFLEESRTPVRLACNGRSGHPLLASLWFRPEAGALWCATQKSARVARLLASDPRCAFEVSEERAPYRGVRGQGIARLDERRGPEVLRTLMERYRIEPASPFGRWLLERADRETALAIVPDSVVAWDYRDRMGSPA